MAEKYALLIGNNCYQDPNIRDLTKPANDVKELARLLTAPNIGGFAEANVQQLIDKDYATVQKEIARFFKIQCKREDVVLFFYAGHGLQDSKGELHLAVKDTEEKLLEGTAISTTFIANQMGNCRAKQLIILDCCNSGAFPNNQVSSSVANFVVLTASDSLEYAWETGDSPNSVFTHHLIQGLQTGQADLDKDGQITVDELLEYVKQQIANPKQNPIKSGRQKEPIIIAKAVPPTEPPVPEHLLNKHCFISYSAYDGQKLAEQLYQALTQAKISVWLDRYDVPDGTNWDNEIREAIKTCGSFLLLMTADSVDSNGGCAGQWEQALKQKKSIIPLCFAAGLEQPAQLGKRTPLEFTANFKTGLEKLHQRLQKINTPPGILQDLRDRKADADNDLRRERDPQQQKRIIADIEQLRQEITHWEKVVKDPKEAAHKSEMVSRREVRQERVALSKQKKTGTTIINSPPGTIPAHFQGRLSETQQLANFLTDTDSAIMVITGRGGIGKTVLACRVLKILSEEGHLPNHGAELAVQGVIYFSARAGESLNFPNLYADVLKLLPADIAKPFEAAYLDAKVSSAVKMRALLTAFPSEEALGGVIVLLDNFEDLLDPTTEEIKDKELQDALQSIWQSPDHRLKLIITSRVMPRSVAEATPGRWRLLPIDDGLAVQEASAMLRALDKDGRAGCQEASEALLAKVHQRTQGYPRALEAVYNILVTDRTTTLTDIAADATTAPLFEKVVQDLVGEAFSRLDPIAQQVMQALAIYNRAMPASAVGEMMRAYYPALLTQPMLNRLVNLQFVRLEKQTGRYDLHPEDRQYALARLKSGSEQDIGALNAKADSPPFTKIALCHLAADYLVKQRAPRAQWKKITDLDAHLAEFELRYASQEYTHAAKILEEISFDYLILWGHYHLLIDLHERLRGKISKPELESTWLNNLGSAYYSIGQYQLAMACYEQGLMIARLQKNWQVAFLGNLGLCYADLGQTDKAMEYYQQASAINRKIGDRKNEGVELGNLGNCYVTLGQTNKAIEYYQQALAINREVGNRSSNGLGNLGYCYAILGQTDQAIEYLQQALAISREIGNERGKSVTLRNLGNISLDQERYPEALDYFQQSLTISQEIGQPVATVNGFLAQTYLYLNDLASARTAIETACQYDEPTNNANAAILILKFTCG